MLKKVMIICLALSFVFIGSIGIALAADHLGPPAEPPMGPRGDHDGSCQDFISHDSSIIIADGKGEGDGTGEYGPGDCSFISHDSSIIIAAQDGPKSGHDIGPAPNSHDGDPDGPGW